MYVIGVSKTYSNYSKNRNYHTKKHGFKLYFYDSNGIFRVKKITFIKMIYYRLFVKKHKIKRVTCSNCFTKYKTVGGPAECPKCF